MVGTVIFKSNETGSYREMRITVYNGSYYSDISQKDFSTYTFDVLKRKTTFRFSSSKSAPSLGIFEIYDIVKRAVSYLSLNKNTVCAEFKKDGFTCTFRTVSAKSAFSAPDFINMKMNKGIYILCKGTENLVFSPLKCSLICDILNFSFCSLFNSSFKLYYHFGSGIYADISVFLKSPVIKSEFKRAIHSKKYKILSKLYHETTGLNLSWIKPVPIHFEHKRADEGFERSGFESAVNAVRYAKTDACNYIGSAVNGKIFSSDTVKYLLALPNNEKINTLVSYAYDELLSLGHKYAAFGYIESKNHIPCANANEILRLSLGAHLNENTAENIKTRYKNHKLISSYPPTEIMDNFGNAY